MKSALKIVALLLAALVVVSAAGVSWHLYSKQPRRSDTLKLTQLKAPVSVRHDERGVPHIRTENEADLYRALGYVQAQDRLFQMEMMRPLAQGELAQILGPKLADVDRLLRTLGMRARAQTTATKMDLSSASSKALIAYLDGINQFQASHPAPMEFALPRLIADADSPWWETATRLPWRVAMTRSSWPGTPPSPIGGQRWHGTAQHLSEADVAASTRSTLLLAPAR